VDRPALAAAGGAARALARSRASRTEAREPLLATITGIAAGMRNTG
jgi:phosphoenolpyruvate carboxylase